MTHDVKASAFVNGELVAECSKPISELTVFFSPSFVARREAHLEIARQIPLMGSLVAASAMPPGPKPVGSEQNPLGFAAVQQGVMAASAVPTGQLRTAHDYYPRIVLMRDNYTHTHTPESTNSSVVTLHVGDPLEVVVEARDPKGAELEIAISFADDTTSPVGGTIIKGDHATLTVPAVQQEHVGRRQVHARVRGRRTRHYQGEWDDRMSFVYDVLRPRE